MNAADGQKRPLTDKERVIRWVVWAGAICVVAGMLVTHLLPKLGQLTPAQRYPGSWQEDVNPALYRAMLLHHVQGCGDLVYKEAYNNSDHPQYPEYLVYCSDGKIKTAYTVFLWPGEDNNTVNGPTDLYVDVPPPERWRKSN